MNIGDLKTWSEPGGSLLRESLRQQARTWHQLHQPPGRLQDWVAMREQLRQQFLHAAGTFPAPPELDIEKHGTLKLDGYQIKKLTYQSRPGLRVTSLLYIPDGPGPFPAVLNMHGHIAAGKIHPRVSDRCQVLAREGFVVLSVDALGAGERATVPGQFEYHGHHPATSLFSHGESLLGMQLYDNMRGVDLLQSLPEVDGDKIGATGSSGGGNQTLWLSALDPRIKASIPVVSIGTFESYVTRYNCWCETLFGGIKIGETWSVLGLIAPNPLLILTAAKERNPAFLQEEMLRSYSQAQKVYALYNAKDKLACQTVDLPHCYAEEMQRQMLGWFRYWLMGDSSPFPGGLPEVPDLPQSDLMCFPGESRPEECRSLLSYTSIRTQECRARFLSAGYIDPDKKREELKELMKLPDGPALIRLSPGSCEETGQLRVCKFSVEVEPAVLLPCVLISTASEAMAPVAIAVHGNSKDACASEATVQSIIGRGSAVCLFDLRHTGETKWDFEEFTDHCHVARAEFWLGHTVIGKWVRDILAVRAALEDSQGASDISLLGFEEAALATLAVAAIDPGFSHVQVERLLSTYVLSDVALSQRYSIYIPDILNWGDVSLIAALAQAPLKVSSLVHPSGETLDPKEQSGWVMETHRLTERMNVGEALSA